MTDRGDRSDRLRKRFEDDAEGDETRDQPGGSSAESADEAGESADEDDSEDTASETNDERADGPDVGADDTPLKERSSVLMYLPEGTRRDLDIRFDELNARYKREHGEPLEKNRDYYPAVIEAGLSDETVEEILDL
jgi:hypothetical protein